MSKKFVVLKLIILIIVITIAINTYTSVIRLRYYFSLTVNQSSCFVSANGLIDVRDPCVVSDRDNGDRELLQDFSNNTEYEQR